MATRAFHRHSSKLLMRHYALLCLYYYVAVILIDIKTKYNENRCGLEQEEVGPLFIIRVNACGDSQYCSSSLVLTISKLFLTDE